MATDQNRPRIPEVAVSASAAVGGFASLLAWAACCVLPLALSVAGVSFAGVAVLAGARHWLTPIAALVLAACWLLHWRRSRMCRRDAACGRPSRLAFWLLKPLPGDCCVFCSYADVPCPPIQEDGKGCCG